MRNFRPNHARHPLSGGDDHDEDELARISAGLRAARPAVPHELRERVRALRPTEPAPKRRPGLNPRIPALLAIAGAAAAVAAVAMMQVARVESPSPTVLGIESPSRAVLGESASVGLGVESPSRAGRVLVAMNASSRAADGRRLVRAIDDALTEEPERYYLRQPRDHSELVAIGSDGDVSARIGFWEPVARSSDLPSTSSFAHTLRAALTRPASQSELGSALNAAGWQVEAGAPNAARYLVILTDEVPADSSTFERGSDSDRAIAARIRRLHARNIPDLRGVRVRLVSVRSTSARKPSPRAVARARLSLAWARATGATVDVN